MLAAGAGSRLLPLTRAVPKALCPVAGTPLVDLALARVEPQVDRVAVNLHHGGWLIDEHLAAHVHRSYEEPEALGTAGAIGHLRPWFDGSPVLVANADAWLGDGVDVAGFVDDWDRERVRLLCVEDPARGDFGSLRYCGLALLPASVVAGLPATPAGLYEVSWRSELEAGRLDLVVTGAPFVDCGTPADYLAANLLAAGGSSWVSPEAEVGEGAVVERSVVWSGAEVASGEHLVDAVRTPSLTVLVRSTPGGRRATERRVP